MSPFLFHTVMAALTAVSAAPPPVTAPPAPSPAQAFRNAAHAVSADRCGATYAAFGEGLARGARTAVTTMRGTSPDSAQTVSGIVGLSYPDADVVAAAGSIFVTPSPTGCQGQVVRVMSYAKPCAEMVRTITGTDRPGTRLESAIVHDLPQGQAIFLPGRDGCTVVTTITAVMRE